MRAYARNDRNTEYLSLRTDIRSRRYPSGRLDTLLRCPVVSCVYSGFVTRQYQRPISALQSSRIPAFLITLPIFAISDFIVAASCSGELPMDSIPALKNFSFTSSLLITRTMSWFSRVTIASDVLAGAKTAYTVADSYPGRPEAATVGKSGNSVDG